jgi:hypothetical protein
MTLETLVSPVEMENFQRSLMDKLSKSLKVNHQDARHLCQIKSTETQLNIIKIDKHIKELVQYLKNNLNMTATPETHTLVYKPIAIDVIHVDKTRLLTEQTTDVHK